MTTNIRSRALVTGASSGIGAAFAERFAKDGYDLVIVARRRDKLEELAERLQQSYKVNVDVLIADLSKPNSLRTVEKRIANSSLDLLVNNAGFGGYMPFVDLDPDKAEELINLKMLAVTRLTACRFARNDSTRARFGHQCFLAAGVQRPVGIIPITETRCLRRSKCLYQCFH